MLSKAFGGGYMIEFKTISLPEYEKYEGDIGALRRNAISLHSDNSPKFTIDISK